MPSKAKDLHCAAQSLRFAQDDNLQANLTQQFERVRPVIAKKARDAPEHAQGFDGARSRYAAHICRFPTELILNLAHGLLGCFMIAADEHGWLAALELRIHHAGVADRIEGLHEVRA